MKNKFRNLHLVVLVLLLLISSVEGIAQSAKEFNDAQNAFMEAIRATQNKEKQKNYPGYQVNIEKFIWLYELQDIKIDSRRMLEEISLAELNVTGNNVDVKLPKKPSSMFFVCNFAMDKNGKCYLEDLDGDGKIDVSKIIGEGYETIDSLYYFDKKHKTVRYDKGEYNEFRKEIFYYFKNGETYLKCEDFYLDGVLKSSKKYTISRSEKHPVVSVYMYDTYGKNLSYIEFQTESFSPYMDINYHIDQYCLYSMELEGMKEYDSVKEAVIHVSGESLNDFTINSAVIPPGCKAKWFYFFQEIYGGNARVVFK